MAAMLGDPGGFVYGTILVATLLDAEAAAPESYSKTSVSVVIALLLYWLTVTYSHYAGERLAHEQRFHWTGLAREAVRELSLLTGSVVPLIVLLVCWLAGVALATADVAAIWAAVAAIIGAEVIIGIRADLEGRELIRQTAVGALIGVLIVVLRLLLH